MAKSDKRCTRLRLKAAKYFQENKQRDTACSWVRRLNIVEMSILLKLSYKFNTILIKNPSRLFVETDKLILKFIWKLEKPRTAKAILKKKNKAGELTSQF